MTHTAEDIPADLDITLSSPPAAAAGTLVLLLLLSCPASESECQTM